MIRGVDIRCVPLLATHRSALNADSHCSLSNIARRGTASSDRVASHAGTLAASSGTPTLLAADVWFGDRVGRGGIAHREAGADDAVVFVERAGDAGGGRHEADLADAAGAEWALGVLLFDEDQLHLGHLMRAEDAAVVHFLGVDHAAFGLEIFGERVADAHVERAVHLAFELRRVENAADVVGGDHVHEPAVIVEDRHLRGEAIA